MKFCLIHIVLILTVFPASIYGGWLDEFYETQEYANETFKYLKGSSGKTSVRTRKGYVNFMHRGRWRVVTRREIDAHINEASRTYGVHPAFIRAVILAESNFENSALSKKGAMGLCQIMPGTARSLGVTDPWNPGQNIRGATSFLKSLLREFNDPHKALAAYNWGPNNVRNKKRIPAETRIYVDRVLKKYRAYRTSEK